MVYTFRPRQKEEEKIRLEQARRLAELHCELDDNTPISMTTFVPIMRTYRNKSELLLKKENEKELKRIRSLF